MAPLEEFCALASMFWFVCKWSSYGLRENYVSSVILTRDDAGHHVSHNSVSIESHRMLGNKSSDNEIVKHHDEGADSRTSMSMHGACEWGHGKVMMKSWWSHGGVMVESW